MTIPQMDALAVELARINGISLETAERYVAMVGDTPEVIGEDYGLVTVRDEEGNELARVQWPIEG